MSPFKETFSDTIKISFVFFFSSATLVAVFNYEAVLYSLFFFFWQRYILKNKLVFFM